MLLGDDFSPGETGPPPFFQERTVPLADDDWRVRVGQVAENLDRWRPALLMMAVAFAAVVIGVAGVWQTQFGEPATDEQTATSNGQSAIDALVTGVSTDPVDGTIDGAAVGAGIGSTGVTGVPDNRGDHQDEDQIPPVPPISDGDPPGDTATTLSSTTEPPAPSPVESSNSNGSSNSSGPTSSTTTERTTTTEPTTATTEPPEPCTATVNEEVELRSNPDNSGLLSSREGTVPAGDYDLLDTQTIDYLLLGDTTWYQIDAAGTIGWVEEASVSSTQGDCG